MRAIFTLAIKDLRLLARDRLNLLWMFGIPLVFAVFFGSIIGGFGPSAANPLRVAIIEEAIQSDGARAFVERLGASKSIELQMMGRDDAERAVRRGHAVGFIAIKPRAASDNPFFDDLIPDVELGIDPSRQAESGILRGLVMEAAFGGFREVFSHPQQGIARARRAGATVREDRDLSTTQRVILTTFFRALEALLEQTAEEGALAGGETAAGFEPSISTVDVARDRSGQPRTSYEIAFPSSILWGLLAVASSFSISILRERKQGTLLRLLTAPMPRAAVLGGKALACFLAGCTVIVVLMLVSKFAFGVRIASPAGFALAVVSSSLCFVGLAVLMSVCGRTEEAVSGISWGVFILFAMLGGSMVPLVAMPPLLATLSDVSPVKWAIISLEGAIWRDFSLEEMLPSCGVLLGIGLVCFTIGARVLARRGL